MFIEYFNFFCNCIVVLFDTMKKFVLFKGFSYYNFIVAILVIPIFFKLFNFIKNIDHSSNSNNTKGNVKRYDEYKEGSDD